ncbi:MAG: glycosyltransferase family 39 protein [Candidatus Sulfotelmatobacter sp.]
MRADGGSWLGRLDSRFEAHSGLIAAAVIALGLIWRLWLAQATFFNTDEAWHFSLADQSSAWLAYKASLTISHPPLLILMLHFWRALGTSNLMLRLPSVLAGAAFCWIFYRWLDLVGGRAAAWAGLILATFLWSLISTSAEVRQNPLLLVFSVAAIYLLERALAESSVGKMLASAACLYLAMLSHYSAFFVAGAVGIYAIARMWAQKPSGPVLLSWIAGQTGGVALAGFLYKTHLGRLGSLLDQSLLPQRYLYSSYFHSGKDHLLPFLYRGTFGVFRFIFGQTQIGQLAALLFVAGIVALFVGRHAAGARNRALGILLVLPFVLNWIAAAAGLYPYGRMRQCMFLAIFALAGVAICLGRIEKERPARATAVALGIVILCQAFGTRQDRDALPLADQRHQHMDQAMQFIRSHVSADDVIFTDKATSFQVAHYLCRQRPMVLQRFAEHMETFRCDGLRVVSTGAASGALTADTLASGWQNTVKDLHAAGQVWVVQGGWASGLGESLRAIDAEFSAITPHNFGRYFEIFEMPPARSSPSPTLSQVRISFPCLPTSST